MVRIITYLLIVLFISMACNESTPDQKISDTEFATIYAEYLVIGTNDTAKTELKTQYLENVLADHGFTIEDFRETWQALDAMPEKWENIMRDVTDIMQERQEQMKHKDILKKPEEKEREQHTEGK